MQVTTPKKFYSKNTMAEDAKAQEGAQKEVQADKTPEQLEAEAKAAAEKKAKQDAKKAAKAEAKAAKEAAKAARQAAASEFKKDPNDPCADKFGDLELIRSQCDPETRFTKKYVEVKDLDASLAGQDVRVRCRLHNSRGKGKTAFVIGR